MSSTLSSSSSFAAGRVSRIWKLTLARKGSRIASRSWSRSTSSRMASMVKTCCPGRGRSPSGPARAQFCHSGLGARSARLLQSHRPDGAEPQAAPDAVRQLGDHGANWFELIAFQRKIKIFSRSDEHFFFSVTFWLVSVLSRILPRHSESVLLPCRFSAVRSSLEASSSPLQGGEGRALGRQRDRQPLSDLLADELLLHLVELSLDLRQRGNVARANPALPQGLTLLAERLAALLALLGHRGSGAAGRALVEALAKLEPKLLGSWACFSMSLQSCMSTSSAGNLPATPSASTRSSALPEAAQGLSCSRRSRTWVVIPIFLMSKKIGCGIDYSGHLRDGGSTRRSVTSRLKPHMPLINHKLRALSLTRAAQ